MSSRSSLRRVWARQRHDEIDYRRELLADDNPIYPEYVLRGGLLAKLPALPLRASLESMLVTRRNASDDNTLEAGARRSLPSYALLDVGACRPSV